VVAPGSALIYSGSDGSLIDEIFGSSDGDLFGSEVASAGDVNGDGQQDFIVTAFFGDYARVFTSTATVSVLGDVDLNGFVNFFDIAPFISLLADQQYQLEADMNMDGVVNFFDIAPFIQVLSQ